MSRPKTTNIPDLAVLLSPHNAMMQAAEGAILGQAWSRAAAPVAEQIAVRLASLITLDHIHAGQRLLEKDISQVLNVSRAPVREALRILERERLVEFQPRRGALVTAPSSGDLSDIYVVRAALYGILLRQLMEECPAELDAVFERHMPKLRSAADQGADAYALASFLLNLEITQLCSNRLVVDLLTSISLRTLRYVRLGLAAEPASITLKLETWSALQRAVAKRDMDAVLRTARQRIEASRDAALRTLISEKGSRRANPRTLSGESRTRS